MLRAVSRVVAGVGDHDADLRRQVLAGLVQVDLELLARDAGDAAQLDLLAEDRGLFVTTSATVASPAWAARPCLDGLGAGGGDGVENLVGERDELVVLGDEVGLAGELDQRGVAVELAVRGDEALRGGAVGALGVALRPFRRRISTAFSTSPSASTSAFLVSTMPVPSALAQRLDVSGGKFAIT